MVRNFLRFLHPVFSASGVQHISDLHSIFAIMPHQYGRQSATAEHRRGKKKIEDRNHSMKI